MRRRLVARAISLMAYLRIAGQLLKDLFSYESDGRERASSQMLFLVSGAFVAFLIWGYFAHFDQVITAQAKVYPFSRLQTIEHFEGGRIEKIHVRQGDSVKSGDLLIALSPLQTESELNVQKDSVAALGIRLARLLAEYEGKPSFAVDPDVERQFAMVVQNERALFLERRNQRQASLMQRSSDILSAKARVRSTTASLEAVEQELKIVRQLVERGLEPALTLIRSEKTFGEARAAAETAEQDLSRAESAYTFALKESQTAVLGELAKVRSDFTAASQGIRVAADKADRSQIRSPLDGVVNRVLVSTEGGTVKPGETVVEIVPLGSTIIVEANVLPADIGFVEVGQKAQVKLTAYDFALFGAIEGEVSVVAADSITNEKGEQFYVVKIDLKRAFLEAKGRNLRVIPGMTAQVDIVTGSRNALEYVFSPIARVLKESLREK